MRSRLPGMELPDHLGLAYGAWAPVRDGGKVPEKERSEWFSKLSRLAISQDYQRAFDRWTSSFTAPGDRLLKLKLTSRLLVGHGNPGPTDVGLTIHRTWGVPVIPGSALKGLLAHYVAAVYGPERTDLPPWEQPEGERERARYQAVAWSDDDRRILRGPGDVHRALFGAPDAEEDDGFREHDAKAGAAAGLVTFHDALYVPSEEAAGDRPFAADVLTVHQDSYYSAEGREIWPNDFDGPKPVSFLSVRPGVQVLLALSGLPDWTALAKRLLVDALQQWGVGGKTTGGYGRLAPPAQVMAVAPVANPEARAPRYRRGDRVPVTRVEGSAGKTVKFLAPDGVLGHFSNEAPPAIAAGEAVEVWIANVNSGAYTLTLRQPRDKTPNKRR